MDTKRRMSSCAAVTRQGRPSSVRSRVAARPVLFRQYFKRGDLPRFKVHDARTPHTLFVGLRREDVPAIEAPKDAQSSAA